MTDRQENKMSMYLAVKQTVDTFNASWAGLLAFVNSYGNFISQVDEIAETRQLQEGATEGVTMDKAQAKEEAVTKAVTVASGVSAYASVTENHTLEQLVNYSTSDLKLSRDTILVDKLGVIYNAGNDNIVDLAGYGILPADITELDGLITSYNDLVQAPRVAIGDAAAATDRLVELFEKADGILKGQMDKLMVVLKQTDGEFYVKYKGARVIVDLGKGGGSADDSETPVEP